MHKAISKNILVFMAVAVLGFASPITWAQSDEAGWDRWSAHNNESEVKLNHSMLDMIYSYSIVTFQKARRGSAGRQRPGTGSRIGSSTRRPSRQKKLNVIPYKALANSASFRQVLNEYLGFMQEVPVSILNENEQLAFWLNFHNAGLLRAIVSGYPVKKLDKFMAPGSTGQGFYQERRFVVEGVELSLEDIRDRIILANWSDPMTLYGIFTGTQSSPNLMVSAYTGRNLNRLLRRNAKDFISSKRGVSVGGQTLKYNMLYQWHKEIFGGEDGVLAHIKEYAGSEFADRIAGTDRLGTIKYSWKLNEIRASAAMKAGLPLEGGLEVDDSSGTAVWDSSWNTGAAVNNTVGNN